MIHSLYSHPEIFLRELISNASDAADKLRFEALEHPDYYESDPDLRITRRRTTSDARTITVRDNGIGMSRDEVVAHIGTIAKSGTREFFAVAVRRPGEGRAADRPVRRRLLFVVHRRRPRDARHAARRAAGRARACAGSRPARASTRSSASTGRSAAPRSRCTCAKGRTSCCRAGGWPRSSASIPTTSRCRSVMRKEVWDEDEEGVSRDADEDETVNQASRAVGAAEAGHHRRSSTTSSTSTSRTTRQPPLAHVHAQGRGPHRVHAAAVRSVGRAVRPVGPRASARRQALRAARVHHGRRRAAAAAVPALRPRRRRLATTCRSTCRARSCRSRATSKRSAAAASSACSTCSRSSPSSDKEKYATFWSAFGNVLKEGFVDDHGNRDKLAQARALRVDGRAAATRRTCALADYVARMKEGQQAIYYVTGDTFAGGRATARTSRSSARRASRCCCCPTASTNGWRSTLTEFDGKPLRSVAKGALDLGELADAEEKAAAGARGDGAEAAGRADREGARRRASRKCA